MKLRQRWMNRCDRRMNRCHRWNRPSAVGMMLRDQFGTVQTRRNNVQRPSWRRRES
jgi:hypothetical protein